MGLLGTHSEFQRRGLASQCLGKVIEYQSRFKRSLKSQISSLKCERVEDKSTNDNKNLLFPVLSYCCIEPTNIASRGVVRKMGFIEIEGLCLKWVAARKKASA